MIKNGDKSVVVNIVKEAFDVYREKGGRKFTVESVFNVVCEGETGVNTRGTGHASELFGGDEVVAGAVKHEAFSHDLFQEFAEAF
jgi:hypothetical protein